MVKNIVIIYCLLISSCKFSDCSFDLKTKLSSELYSFYKNESYLVIIKDKQCLDINHFNKSLEFSTKQFMLNNDDFNAKTIIVVLVLNNLNELENIIPEVYEKLNKYRLDYFNKESLLKFNKSFQSIDFFQKQLIMEQDFKYSKPTINYVFVNDGEDYIDEQDFLNKIILINSKYSY